MIWLWKTDDLRVLRLVQRHFFLFMVLYHKATEVYLPSRFWGIVQGTMFEFRHAADSFWLQHWVWTDAATSAAMGCTSASSLLIRIRARLGASWSGICVFFDIYHVGMATGWHQNFRQFCLKKTTIQMHRTIVYLGDAFWYPQSEYWVNECKWGVRWHYSDNTRFIHIYHNNQS